MTDSGRASDLAILEHWYCCPCIISPLRWRYAWDRCPVGTSSCGQVGVSQQIPSHFHQGSWCNPPFSWFLGPWWGSQYHWTRSIPTALCFPPPCLTVGTVFFGLYASLFFLQKYLASIWQNSSNFVSWDHKMVDQKLGSFVRWRLAKARRAFRCFFLRSGAFRDLCPCRPPLCKIRSMVDRDTFVPA